MLDAIPMVTTNKVTKEYTQKEKRKEGFKYFITKKFN